MNYHLVNAILRAPWLIDQEWILNRGAVIHKVLTGERIYDDDDGGDQKEEFNPAKRKNVSYVINSKSVEANRWYGFNDPDIPEGSTAVIPIRSEIVKYDAGCGMIRGTLSLEQEIKQADSNPKITSIVLVIDSPGGEVTHTDIISNTIANCETPVTAFVEGMACSAAYWIASSADRIVASSNIDRVGSIGTMCYFADVTPYYEKMGVKFHEFYASKSTEKNRDFNEVLTGKYENYTKNVLDRLNENFHQSVMANRPNLDPKVLKGASYFAADGIDLGLIDEIGSFDCAISQANDVMKKKCLTANQKSTDNMKANKAWTAITSLFTIAPEKAEETDITPEMVEKMNTELAARELRISELEAKAEKLTEIEGKLSDVTTELQSEKDAHQATRQEFESFKKADAGTESTSGKKQDKIEETSDFEAYSHNKAVDEILG